ncbi:MAG: S41 family peptidase [Rhodobacteraceae bacterium]|nr:MAG: S41 family peptidase [Paracoccaceae bacterium]
MARSGWVLVPGFVALFTIGAVAAETRPPKETEADREALALVEEVFRRIRAGFVDDVDASDLVEAAIGAMLSSLDRHSAFLPPEDFDEMRIQAAGRFGGLGIEVGYEDGAVVVIAPMDDTPAAEAGLAAGDRIVRIDGAPVRDLTLGEAIRRMRGPVGEAVRIVVERGEAPPRDVEIVRDMIRVTPVRGRLEGDVAVLRISTFNGDTTGDLEAEIVRLQEEAHAEGIELAGFVLDLRNNPGGLLTEAVGVSDILLDGGRIVETRGRGGVVLDVSYARAGDRLNGAPLVVLVNRGSASASEIVAGALADHGRALLIGETTFGKGSVQTVAPLGSDSAVRMTVARYYSPSGRSIDGHGVEPHIVVRLTEDEAREVALAGRRRAQDADADDDRPLSARDPKLSRAVEILRAGRLFVRV